MINIRTKDIKSLTRRANFLAHRIEEFGEGKCLNYDRAELVALTKVIKYFEEKNGKDYGIYDSDAGRDYSPSNWISHQPTLGDRQENDAND